MVYLAIKLVDLSMANCECHNQRVFFVDYQRLTMVMVMVMMMVMVVMMMMMAVMTMAVMMMVIFMSTKSTINLIYSMAISD